MEKIKLHRPVLNIFPVSSPFGMRTIGNTTRMHNGIDFATPLGTPIFAMVDGKVFRAGYENADDIKQGYGLRIWQEFTYNDEQYYAWYGHLSNIQVKHDEYLRAECLIGFTGNSGRSTGPHLHVGVRKKNTGKYYDMEFENV